MRKLRGNGERMRKWRENEEMLQNVKYGTFVANFTKNLYLPLEKIILGRIHCEKAPQVLPVWPPYMGIETIHCNHPSVQSKYIHEFQKSCSMKLNAQKKIDTLSMRFICMCSQPFSGLECGSAVIAGKDYAFQMVYLNVVLDCAAQAFLATHLANVRIGFGSPVGNEVGALHHHRPHCFVQLFQIA